MVVTSLRPKWVAYRKRPKGLTSGWCAALDREVGTEFSRDEGASWLVVRTEPKYVDEASSCLTMRFMASPSEDARVGSWKEVNLEDDDHVLLERHWRG